MWHQSVHPSVDDAQGEVLAMVVDTLEKQLAAEVVHLEPSGGNDKGGGGKVTTIFFSSETTRTSSSTNLSTPQVLSLKELRVHSEHDNPADRRWLEGMQRVTEDTHRLFLEPSAAGPADGLALGLVCETCWLHGRLHEDTHSALALHTGPRHPRPRRPRPPQAGRARPRHPRPRRPSVLHRLVCAPLLTLDTLALSSLGTLALHRLVALALHRLVALALGTLGLHRLQGFLILRFRSRFWGDSERMCQSCHLLSSYRNHKNVKIKPGQSQSEHSAQGPEQVVLKFTHRAR